MNWMGHGRSGGILMQGTIPAFEYRDRVTRKLNRYNRHAGRDMNSGRPEHEVGRLKTRPPC